MDLELAIFDFYAVPTPDAAKAPASYPQALIVAGEPALAAFGKCTFEILRDSDLD